MNLRRKEGHKTKQSTKHNEMCLSYFLPLLFWNIETHVCVIMKNNDIKMPGAASGTDPLLPDNNCFSGSNSNNSNSSVVVGKWCWLFCQLWDIECLHSTMTGNTWDATKQYKILNCKCFAGNKIIFYLFIACKVREK